ncbi:hypothetical protein SXIM_37660 [Streptomyces xiamenensis]|uniref:Uncharacterized protein n=1 Tax=Streptomyces xiamenensis TaxID=408015 RepID=A0A0F7FYL7_9ACTN|nr:hypothetical protein SXIM_37660 [Streptomyces xiamenensis]
MRQSCGHPEEAIGDRRQRRPRALPGGAARRIDLEPGGVEGEAEGLRQFDGATELRGGTGAVALAVRLCMQVARVILTR